MAAYLAFRIMDGALDYEYVVGKRPDLKSGIDKELIAHGRNDLIVLGD
jgi:hypothetical protein